MDFETTYEITGNEQSGFYVYQTTIGYGGRCQSGSFLADQEGMRKRFDSRSDAENAVEKMLS